MHTSRHTRKNSGFSTQDEPLGLLGLEALTEAPNFHYATRSTYPLAWSPDGVLLATRSCEDTIAVWDAATGQLKHLWEGHLPLLRSRVDQPQAVASHRRDETGFTLQLREEVKHGVVMAWSPTGSLLATAGWDRTIKVWNLHSGARLALACCLAPIYLVDFTDDGQSLLVVDNGSATCNRPICYWLELSNSPAGESVQPAEPECSDLGENSLANELLAAKRLWRRLHPLLVGTLGEAHPEMFNSLASLAKTYELFQEHADAEWCYREGLTLLECFHGPDDVNVAVCCHNLASLCQGQGRLEEAAALYWRSLDILKKHGTNSDDQLIVLLNLGWLYHEDLQDYAQAELLFREAFELTRTAHGAVHPKTVESLYHLGTMLLLQDDHDRALDCFREAIDVIEQLDRPDARQLADVLDGLEALEPSEEVDALIQRTRDLLALLSGQIPPGTVPADGTIDPQQLAELLQRCTDQQGKFDRGAFDELGRQLGFTFIGPLQRDGKRYLLLTLKGTTSSQNFALEFSPSTVAKASAPAVPAPADSTLPLDQLIPLFWTHPEHAATWRHYFQNTSQRKQLLLQVLSHLPAELGQVSFVEDRPSDPFILLVTYDEESEGGRENAAQVFTVLANHGAVTFFGSEGAWGRCDVEWVRALSPDKDNIRELAWDALCSFKFHPVEYAAIVCDEPVALWGIEDQELYQKVKQTYKPGSPVFQELMHRRETVVWTNLLALMEQQGCVIAGASVTMGAFWTGHRLLQERNIAHAGIFCRSSGKHRSGYLDAVHQGQMKDDLSLEGRPDKPTPPTPLRHETVPLLNRPAWGERRHLPGSALIYFISLLVGVVICWWGSWGWLCGIPIIGLCGFLLVRLSLAASGWPMNVPCPRCGTSATLWRRRHIMCPCCGSVEC